MHLRSPRNAPFSVMKSVRRLRGGEPASHLSTVRVGRSDRQILALLFLPLFLAAAQNRKLIGRLIRAHLLLALVLGGMSLLSNFLPSFTHMHMVYYIQ